MGYVLVEDVYDPDGASRELVYVGQELRARQVRERGKGVFVMTDVAELGSDRERALAGLAMWRAQRQVTGLSVRLRLDFDPDWRIQTFAVEEALREVPALRERSAVAAVNVFRRAYYGYDARWDIADHGDGRWPQVDARNFADAAYLVANALGGLRFVHAERVHPVALDTAARIGWAGDEPRGGAELPVEVWLAFSLGRTLRQGGEGHLERLCQAFEAGGEGNS